MKVMEPEGERGGAEFGEVAIARPLSGQGVIRQRVDYGLLQELVLSVAHG